MDSLPGKAAQKVVWVLKLIEDLEIVPSRYFSKLTGTEDIWECRVGFGSNIYRLFGFLHAGEVILTHGLVKKTQKTPRSEIERAEAIKKEYWTSQRKEQP